MAAIIGHTAILRELANLAALPEPAHALLLAGPESTGRSSLALEYAKLLNCEAAAPGATTMPGFEPPQIPCGSCRACRLISEQSHPDVVRMVPGDVLCKPGGDSSHASHADSRDIRICQVRGAIDLSSRYPFEARHRVIIVDPAERITPAAANAMLKTLEEPPGHTVFVLISTAPEQLLETVISRCRRIDVGIAATAEIEAGLLARGIEPAVAHEAAVAARGRPGRAIAFAEKPDLMGDRGRLLQRCERIAASPLSERARYATELVERWRADRATVMRELAIWEEFWEENLHAAANAPEAGTERAREALTALDTVAAAREYLMANCLPRAVFDFMLFHLPRRTLDPGSLEAAGAA